MDYLEALGAAVGLLYLWLEYKASIYVWVTGIIMPAIYIFVYYRAGLYADFAINIYYVIAAAYGLAMWRTRASRESKSDSDRIIHTPARLYPTLLAAFALLFAAIGILLESCTDSDVPWWDSFTTALSIVAMYMLAHKHAEQWLAWILVDAVCCGLYIYKGLYATSALYALYTVIAVAGYRAWAKLTL